MAFDHNRDQHQYKMHVHWTIIHDVECLFRVDFDLI